MSRIIAILLLCSLSFQSMVKLGIMAWYQVNKTYVATVLCENKDKPEMNCCGKCYVRKQMDKADAQSESSKQAPAKQIKAETVDFLMPVATTPATIAFTPAQKIFNGHYTNPKGYEPADNIFHPPPVC